MKQYFKTVELQDIEDNTFYDLHPFLEDSPVNNDLIQSIQMIGILTPPVLIEKTGGKYDILCGHQRIRHLRFLKTQNCFCQLLDEQCSAETMLHIILEDQFIKGPLTTIEQACYLMICRQLLPDTNRQNAFFKTLLPGRITKGVQYLIPLENLDKSIQSAIHDGRISEKVIKDILHFNSADQNLLLSLIQSLHLGGNNQKKLIVQLRDILRRNNTNLVAFTESQEVQEILLNKTYERSEKSSRFLDIVHRLHQPMLTSSQDSFDQEIKSLKLPNSITITHSGSFEKDEVTLSVCFRSLEAFKHKWKDIGHFLCD